MKLNNKQLKAIETIKVLYSTYKKEYSGKTVELKEGSTFDYCTLIEGIKFNKRTFSFVDSWSRKRMQYPLTKACSFLNALLKGDESLNYLHSNL